MTTSLLWSALLIATFLGPVVVDTESTVSSLTSNQSELQSHKSDSTLDPNSTYFTGAVKTASTKSATTKALTPALPTTTAKAKSSECPTQKSQECDCFKGMTEWRDNTGLLMFGGLTLVCVILLITTMMLACKLCTIKRRFRDYQICHVEASPANGRAGKADEPKESSIMMSEVSKGEGAARDSAENNQSKEKEKKEEKAANGGSAQKSAGETGAAESDKAAAPDNADANESTALLAKEPESSAEETTAAADDNKAKDEADGGAKNVAEGTKTEAAPAEKSTTEA